MENPFENSITYNTKTKKTVIERRNEICRIIADNPGLSKREIMKAFKEKTGNSVTFSTLERDLTVLRTARDFLSGKLTPENIKEKKKNEYWRRIFAFSVDFLIKDNEKINNTPQENPEPPKFKTRIKTNPKKRGVTEKVKNSTTFGLEEAIEVFKGIAGGLFQWGVENSELKKQVKVLGGKIFELEKKIEELLNAHNGLVKDLSDNYVARKKSK